MVMIITNLLGSRNGLGKQQLGSVFRPTRCQNYPTLWMGGSDDWNVPILNSEQMYLGMKRLGRETQLVVYYFENGKWNLLDLKSDSKC
jgi:hypothetical protein